MSDDTRFVAPLVSLGLAIVTLALIVVGLPVVVAPARTDRYFSWTIDVPLTAAFLGACYWTAALFTLLAAREREWPHVRAVMPGTLVAGTLILVTTLMHIERFAMDTARGWIWVILYAGLPPGVLLAVGTAAECIRRRPTRPPSDRTLGDGPARADRGCAAGHRRWTRLMQRSSCWLSTAYACDASGRAPSNRRTPRPSATTPDDLAGRSHLERRPVCRVCREGVPLLAA